MIPNVVSTCTTCTCHVVHVCSCRKCGAIVSQAEAMKCAMGGGAASASARADGTASFTGRQAFTELTGQAFT